MSTRSISDNAGSVRSGESPSPGPKVLVFMEATEFGGPARNLAATIHLLRESAGFVVVTFVRGAARSSEFVDALRSRGITCEVVPERFRYDPKCLRIVRRLIADYRPDFVQVHNTKSRLYIHLLRRLGQLGNARVIDCFHGETWTDRKQLLYNKLDRRLFRNSRQAIVVSQSQKALLQSFGVPADRIDVIYNGIRIRPETIRSARHPINILTVGRLSKEKGHSYLLDAVAALKKEVVPAFRVCIVGDGPELGALKQLAADHDITDLVEFAGYQPDPAAFFEAADLFVLPSLSEGVPNVLLEAAMYDVPIVSTAVGGVPEMFDNNAEAILVDAGNAERLSAAITRCLLDPALRRSLAGAARSKVESRFSDVSRARQYLELYQRIGGQQA